MPDADSTTGAIAGSIVVVLFLLLLSVVIILVVCVTISKRRRGQSRKLGLQYFCFVCILANT